MSDKAANVQRKTIRKSRVALFNTALTAWLLGSKLLRSEGWLNNFVHYGIFYFEIMYDNIVSICW